MLKNVSRYYDVFLVFTTYFSRNYEKISRYYEKISRYYEKISRYYDFFLVITIFFS